MSASTIGLKDRTLLAVIGDEVGSYRFVSGMMEEIVTLMGQGGEVEYQRRSQRTLRALKLTKQDSVTGLLLAGIGNVDQQQKKNFLIVDGSEFIFLSCPMYIAFCDLLRM